MSDIQWAESYSVGIPSIDNQHKRLIELNNRLFHAIMEDRGRDMALEVLKELTKYVNYHFSYEEKLLTECGFDPAQLADHVEEHRALTSQVHDYLGAVDREDAIDLVVYDFLREWTAHHLKKTDSNYADFLKSRGIR